MTMTGRSDAQVERVARLLQGTGTFRDAEEGRHRLHDVARARSLDGRRQRGRTETAAGPYRARRHSARMVGDAQSARARWVWQVGRRSSAQSQDDGRTACRRLRKHRHRRRRAGFGERSERAGIRAQEHEHHDGRRDAEQPADARPRRGRHAERRVPARGRRVTSWRRSHRRDHLLHEHIKSQRDARRRIAGEESGREGSSRSARRQDLACAGIARRHRLLPSQRPAAVSRSTRLQSSRVWLHDLHRQLWPARSAHRGRHHQA